MGKRTIASRTGFDYFFVKPSGNEDVQKAAKKLMGIKGIREVAVTEGDYGFVVKADLLYEGENALLHREIAKAVGGTARKAVCICNYRK